MLKKFIVSSQSFDGFVAPENILGEHIKTARSEEQQKKIYEIT